MGLDRLWDRAKEGLPDSDNPFGPLGNITDDLFGDFFDGMLNPFEEAFSDSANNLTGDATDPADTLDEMSRSQYQDYLDNYAPREEAYIGDVLGEDYVSRNVRSAGLRADQSSRQAEEISERNMGRYNTNVTPEQRKAIDRVRKLGFSKNRAGAMNRARDRYTGEQRDAMGWIVDLGRGLARGGVETAGEAEYADTQRTNRNLMSRQQHENDWYDLMTTFAGIFGGGG